MIFSKLRFTLSNILLETNMLKIYNTLTKSKQEFKPIKPGKIGMYVCGVTVYDLCHIGHARTFVNFDVIVRYLRYSGYDVKYVRNITDIDDKIIKRANERGIAAKDLAEQFIVEMHKDFDALNIKRPDIEPRATDNIKEIISIVQKLIDNKNAYVSDNGDVVFDINSFKEYGRLSGQKLDELQAGARIEVARANTILWTLYCGKCQNLVNQLGNLLGGKDVLAGISSVLL